MICLQRYTPKEEWLSRSYCFWTVTDTILYFLSFCPSGGNGCEGPARPQTSTDSFGCIISASFAAFPTFWQAVHKTQLLPLTHFCVAASGDSPCTPSDWLQHCNPRPPWTVRKIGHHGPLFFIFFPLKESAWTKTAAESDQAAQKTLTQERESLQ